MLVDDNTEAFGDQSYEHILPQEQGISELSNERIYHNGPSYLGNAFGRLFFHSSVRLLRLGAKAQLKRDQLWRLAASDSVELNCYRFEDAWKKQLSLKQPSLVKALASVYSYRFLLCMFLYLLYASTQFTLPVLMPHIINSLMYYQYFQMYRVLLYACAIYVNSCCGSIFNHQSQQMAWRLGLNIRAVLTNAIYKKALWARSSRAFTSGAVVNYMSTDCQVILDTLPFFVQGAISPIQIAVTISLLATYIGPYCAISLGVALVAIPGTGVCAKYFASFRSLVQKATDIRIKFIKEYFTAIRFIKYYAWEVPFCDKIERSRDEELLHFKHMLLAKSFMIFLLLSVPGLGVGLTFFFYGLNNSLDLSNTFTALALLNILPIPFILMPATLTFLAQYLVSIRRIQRYITRPELMMYEASQDPNTDAVISIRDADFSWETKLIIRENYFKDLKEREREMSNERRTENKTGKKKQENTSSMPINGVELLNSDENPLSKSKKLKSNKKKIPLEALRDPILVLKDINLSILPGSLAMIVGSVGSGKTSLCYAMMQELNQLRGEAYVASRIAYAAQDPWILNETIRDNITFGQPYTPDKYKAVIEACALKSDLDLLPASDLTEIGERGTNLSGGQRQRINVARAMYSDAPIVILDDPFSAVDSHVGEHMFKEVVLQMRQASRTIVLVTNQLHTLSNADRIFVLQDTKIIESGSFEELHQAGGHLTQLVNEFGLIQESSSKEILDVSSAQAQIDTIVLESKTLSKEASFQLTPERDLINKEKGALIKAEEMETGNISLKVYLQYICSGLVVFFLLALVCQSLLTTARVYNGIWLSRWASPLRASEHSKATYLGVYVGLVLCESAFTLFSSLSMVLFFISISRSIHHQLLKYIWRSTMTWFDMTPSGRILTRFSKDINVIDNILIQQFEQTMSMIFQLFGIFASISTGTVYILIVIFFGVVIFLFLTSWYRKTSIQVQRYESVSRAPIFSHFTKTMEGAVTIRAYNMTETFGRSNINKLDYNTTDYLALRYCTLWLSLTLNFLGNTISFLTLLSIIFVRYWLPDQSDVELMVYAISNTGGITMTLSALSVIMAELETKMNSIERVFSFKDVEEESAAFIEDAVLPPNWPHQGQIIFQDFSLEYTKGRPVLENVNLEIKPREKIGIVGRTGAGKSTLITSLFRMIEPAHGTILIDDVDITKIGLQQLRRKLSIIPQTPQLFIGTVRDNLDPYEEYPDSKIWDVLKLVHLDRVVLNMESGLISPIEENGSNLSLGQRQLISISRCLLAQTSVLLLDEATAAVDLQTDTLIQNMIRKIFKDKTVLTIAHRLNTIMDSDRVMVLHEGKVVEFDSPIKLLENPDGHFNKMVQATGPVMSKYLYDIAKGNISLIQEIPEEEVVALVEQLK